MAFGVYVHIPYCLQLCPYCDFSKYEWQKILPPVQYTELIRKEIRARAPSILCAKRKSLDTVYFGGGTPSLFDPELILAILDELANSGFTLSKTAEITIEINPATVDQKKLDAYFAAGVNRFSVGAQTFNDELLKKVGRKHSAQDTIETLELLKSNRVNYSFDLLFALPNETLDDVATDVARALEFAPSHLSAYYLTVPEDHVMNRGRAPEEVQLEMFRCIEDDLAAAGIARYEISNFAKPGYESLHNMLYWTDQEYWGLGVSAHSYFYDSRWGTRSNNPFRLKDYEAQMRDARTPEGENLELLAKHQALSDFCHTSLRMMRGLDENALRLKFDNETLTLVRMRLARAEAAGWVQKGGDFWRLTRSGRIIANQVFSEVTFLKDDLRGVDIV